MLASLMLLVGLAILQVLIWSAITRTFEVLRFSRWRVWLDLLFITLILQILYSFVTVNMLALRVCDHLVLQAEGNKTSQ